MPYSAPLDGLRALAILAVLVFHVAPSALPGGFTGVDVFFVLSGFLIASIIRRDVTAGTFTLREFYTRRLLRLLPSVVLTVGTVALLWAILLPASTARQTATHGLWALVSLSNVFVWRDLGSYWGNAAESAPLTHTWSLGVEEQFYLLFPLLLAFALRWSRRPAVWVAVIATASLAWCVGWGATDPAGTFYLLPSRIWQLLAGVLLSLWLPTLAARLSSTRARTTVGVAGLVAIAIGVVTLGKAAVFPGLSALWPVVGTLAVLAAVQHGESAVATWLSARPLVAIGRVSYSLYLWHWPLIILGRQYAVILGHTPLTGALLGAAASLVVSAVVYAAVERPLRAPGPHRRWRVAGTLAGLAATLIVTRHVATQPLVADPYGRFDRPVLSGDRYDADRVPGADLSVVVRYYDVTFPKPDVEQPSAYRTGGIIMRYGGDTPDVVVLGSSHALMYSRVIDDLCRAQGRTVAFFGTERRSVFFENDAAFDDARRHWLDAWRPSLVIAIDRWDRRWTDATDVDRRISAFLDVVTPLAKHVAFLTQPPVLPTGDDLNLREFVSWRAGRTGPLPRLTPGGWDEVRRSFHARLSAAAGRWPDVQVVDVAAPFDTGDGGVRYADGRRFLYADDDHLTDAGADDVRALIAGMLADTARRRP